MNGRNGRTVSIPTIRDVASHAGVSVATVSRVVNNSLHKVHPATRQRVLRSVHRLSYHPNVMAQGLRRGTSHSIALIVPDISNPFYPAIARGAEDVARQHGYVLVLGNTDGDAGRERAYLDILRKRWGGGVLLPRDVPAGAVDTVLVDSYAGMRQATSHLLRLGHRRIAYIGGPHSLSVARERLRGYRQALRDFSVPPDPSLIVSGDFRVDGGRAAIPGPAG